MEGLEITREHMLLMDVATRMVGLYGAKPADPSVYLNSLLPLQQGDVVLRQLTEMEMDYINLLQGMVAVIESLSPTEFKAATILTRFTMFLHEASYYFISYTHGPEQEKTYHWAVRRHRNRAYFVERLPNPIEKMMNAAEELGLHPIHK